MILFVLIFLPKIISGSTVKTKIPLQVTQCPHRIWFSQLQNFQALYYYNLCARGNATSQNICLQSTHTKWKKSKTTLRWVSTFSVKSAQLRHRDVTTYLCSDPHSAGIFLGAVSLTSSSRDAHKSRLAVFVWPKWALKKKKNEKESEFGIKSLCRCGIFGWFCICYF